MNQITLERIEYYLKFAESHPHIFANHGDNGEITVILNRDEIIEQQKILYQRATAANQPLHYVDIGIVAEDSWVVVLRDLVKFPNGQYGCYIRLLNRASSVERKSNDCVILPIIRGRVVLLHHFRHDDRRWHLEAPRGFGEAGLSPTTNALKELTEELGITNWNIEIIGGVDVKGNKESVVYFYAYSEEINIVADMSEGISTVEMVTPDKFRKYIADGVVNDHFTISAFAYASIRGII